MRGRAIERRVAACPHGLAQMGTPSGGAARVGAERRHRHPELARDVDEHGVGRRLAGLENAPREAQVKERKRVAEPIGVAALVRNRGEVVRCQGVVTGDPMLVGGRLQVARPQLVA